MNDLAPYFAHGEAIHRYLKNELSDTELKKLEIWASANEENSRLFEELVNENNLKQELMFFDEINMQNAWEKIAIAEGDSAPPMPVRYERFGLRAAAAVLILILGSLAIYQVTSKKTDIAKNANEKTDIAPGSTKAVLTLADGSTILLDSTANGSLPTQGNAQIININGLLSYKTSGNNSETLYNVITTPRGGQYQLILADGSKVWLNAGSSLRFPTAFRGKERKVQLTGEGYFEIAKNKKKPFHVSVNNMDVEVLGTHFNINAYSDEALLKTTLIEGAVKLTSSNATSILKPGQQAQLAANGKMGLNKNVDVDEIVAWKNGTFNFSSQDVTSIMRQISRWYDVDVSYEGKINNETFSGMVNRNSNVSQVLKIMEQAGIKFRIKGKKIVVL